MPAAAASDVMAPRAASPRPLAQGKAAADAVNPAENPWIAMVGKVRALWPAESRLMLPSDPAWLQALKRYDFDAAKAMLQPTLPRGDEVKAWQSAMRRRDADLAKALLVLQPESFEKKLQEIPMERGFIKRLTELHSGESINGQLHLALKLGDPALSEYVKRHPYYSVKPERGLAGELNCIARFAETKDLIACRHLALEWLEQLRKSPDGKPDYSSLSSVDRIASLVPQVRESQFSAARAHAEEAHLVEVDRWGEFAALLSREMAATGETTKRMLVLTSGHAMAAEFKIKTEGGKAQLVQKVYDPNLTNVHRRSSTEVHSTVAEPHRVSRRPIGLSQTGWA